MSAPETSSSFKGRRCPKHGVRHKWRLIDFEMGMKTTTPRDLCEDRYSSMIETLLMQLAVGHR